MSFLIGCNYWASNAGIEMWRQFDADVIRRDFKELKSYGIEYLRVFPLWRDFQVAEPFFGGSHRDKHVYLDKNGLYSKRDDSTFSKPISRPFEFLLNIKKTDTTFVVSVFLAGEEGFAPLLIYLSTCLHYMVSLLAQRIVHSL